MKMLSVFVLVLLVAAALADQFDDFKKQHGKRYRSIREEVRRRGIFNEHIKEIKEHNAKYAKGEETYELGLNQFSDMEPEEIYNGLIVPELKENENYTLLSAFDSVSAPLSLDWRYYGGMTPVKSQGGCGSCWAFSAIGTIESCILLKYGRLAILSEQQLVDCSTPYGNKGCSGGWMNKAFKYTMAVGGVNYQSQYPYTAVQGTCKFNPSTIGGKIIGYNLVPANEMALMNAVAAYGPIAVAINAVGNFRSYKSGVYKTNNCGTGVNHGVIVAGYGKENGQDYWLVKNSWGPGWGDKGYIKMARNYGNMCRIASYGSFVTC